MSRRSLGAGEEGLNQLNSSRVKHVHRVGWGCVYEEAPGLEGVVEKVKGWGGEEVEGPVVGVEAGRGWKGQQCRSLE